MKTNSDHLVEFTDQWALWRWVCLRGAGFPASMATRLACPQSAEAADQLLDRERDAQFTKQAAINKLRDDLPAAGEGNRALLERAIRRLKKGKLTDVGDAVGSESAAALLEYEKKVATVDDAMNEFRRAFEAGRQFTSRAIFDVAGDMRFLEAMIWQNRHAVNTGVKKLVRIPPDANNRTSKLRQAEELIANYVQRYALKNDTIGFFGPVGWAELVEDGVAIQARPGPELLAARTVYMESWCVDAIAESLMRAHSLRRWAVPRRVPFIHLSGNTLHVVSHGTRTISDRQAAMIRACDGHRTASELASELISDGLSGFVREEEVFQLLEQMSDQGLMLWNLEVPMGADAVSYLRDKLERIGDDRSRNASLESFLQIENARSAIAAAAGDPDKLDSAICGLEETFTRLTGTASTRAHGKVYAGRTLVYEDCRRDIEVLIGPEIRNVLAPPISLILASARWYSDQTATMFRRISRKIVEALAKKSGSHIVDALSFWVHFQTLHQKEKAISLEGITAVLQKKWGEILNLDPEQRRVEFTSEQLRPAVLRAFDAPRPGWSVAKYHSPDVMVVASSVEEVQRGNYQLVLGEIHAGVNTLNTALFIAQHPDPDAVLHAIEVDLPETRIIPVPVKERAGAQTRTLRAISSPKDYYVETSIDSVCPPGLNRLQISELVIEDVAGELVIRTRDGRLSFNLLEAFGGILSGIIVNELKFIAPAKHLPRVTIDRLVVRRESWSFSPDDLRFALQKDEAARYVECRRWIAENGIPNQVFVKVPVEKKPFYIDFTSPVYVSIFKKMVWRTLEHGEPGDLLSLTEMLPGPHETWLMDAQDQRYTSELRFVAVDLMQ